ncbi:ribose-phosphate diphosphokinase [Halanaerobium congolense]|jgi:ribose-phosphate pyrophosphokinase|uniref:Ribose-phosphate pyrophosphokinase n=1 Tax=Halanaerobium congolense TaxID=54121 RepID=A0A1G6LNE5_9FIRM|nr:ribose-phosphate pyrophosphokinase [Halanaerobium congolense]OEG63573.1 MAG: ribose-phosphate pyrophosphokinase [Halanaerobium sp. MDAL1]PTX15640.1 ribose-phosphate pyrophosphokinase [Halanaerobium congolense]PXV68732.1 ribose-phosphate pyrophosphokinase [Halanaerobium congolense]TDP09418.1 ribose-phosphate pyrophosphokinase [Halanaerobium congolense]TDS29166.1 ribose-phosphate pyrophosphokinase [Halanaerobium congolense]
MSSYSEQLKIFAGNSHPQLAQDLCDYLGTELVNADVTRFKDGEIAVRTHETVRGADVFVIQPTSPPVNENLMELLIIIDALRRASARRITAVIPYYGYARQDRKASPRDPITSKLVANLLTEAGARRVLSIDFHAPQIQGFFDIPVDHLYASPIMVDYFKNMDQSNLIAVAPDVGSVKRVRSFAETLDIPMAIIDKRRPKPNVAEVMNVIGEVEGKNVILLDDIVDTAGTITAAAKVLKEKGAKDVYACGTHALFSGPAVERLKNAPISKIIVTNTIAQKEHDLDNLEVLSVAPLVGEAIDRIFKDLSVSVLF